MNHLLDQLKALGLKVEKAVDIEAPLERSLPLDQLIDGHWLDDVGKGVFIVEKIVPLGSSHGAIILEAPEDFSTFSRFVEIDPQKHLNDLLFIDTETSSLSTGAGSFVFLVGLAYFVENGLQVVQIFLDSPQNELEFLSHLDTILANFSTFVSYNGKSFDIPMLRNRFILNRLPAQFGNYSHIDLLHTARRIWKLRLESRKLGDIEKEILSYRRGEEEIPGWLVPQIYFDYLESADASSLKGVFYHNEIDVVSLAALFIHINKLLLKQTEPEQGDSRDVYSIANTLGKLGMWELSETFYKSGLEQGLPEGLQNEAARNFAYALKRQDKWAEALRYWQFAADNDDYLACIELAKYYEHREKTYETALQWVESALRIAEDQAVDRESVNHRRERLQKKCEKENER